MAGFSYEKARDLQHVLDLLGKHRNAYILAGGTDILLKIKHGQLRPGFLIGLGHLKELQYIRKDEGGVGSVHIGAGTKINELLKSEILQKNAPILSMVAKGIGSLEVKNMATVGGNICNVGANCGACGLPGCKTLSDSKNIKPCQYAAFADLILPFLILEARILLLSEEGKTTMPLRDFLPEIKKARIRPGTVLQKIYFNLNDGLSWGYTRLATAKSMGITVAAVAVGLVKNVDHTCREMRMALGGAALKKPLLITGIKQLVENRRVDEDVIDAIIAATMPRLSHLENLQFSLEYRIGRIKQLIKEAIMEAWGSEHEKNN